MIPFENFNSELEQMKSSRTTSYIFLQNISPVQEMGPNETAPMNEMHEEPRVRARRRMRSRGPPALIGVRLSQGMPNARFSHEYHARPPKYFSGGNSPRNV